MVFPFFMSFGIYNIGPPNLFKPGLTQNYPRISILGHDDRNPIIAYAFLTGFATPFPCFLASILFSDLRKKASSFSAIQVKSSTLSAPSVANLP